MTNSTSALTTVITAFLLALAIWVLEARINKLEEAIAVMEQADD